MPWLTRLAALTLVLAGLLPASTPAAHAVDVGSDDAHGQFVGSGSSATGTGGAGAPASGGQSGHGCADCILLASDPCSSQYNPLGCGRVTEGCPPGQEQRRFWYSPDAGKTWEDRGVRCVGGREGTSSEPSGREVHDAFARAVPAPHPSAQPARGLLPQVPTLFDSGQPAALEPSAHDLAGVRVVLRPVARWHWDFGDGASLDTQVPGSRYPDLAVSHVYRSAGSFVVRVTTTWTATYTVDGAGPYPVHGTVIQHAQLPVQVGQGRAVLH